jgi:hypothetical protein
MAGFRRQLHEHFIDNFIVVNHQNSLHTKAVRW